MSQQKPQSKKPNEGYTADGGNWEDKSGIFSFLTKNKLFVYHFKEAQNIIADGNGQPIPDGFVKVSFKADENGKLEGGKKRNHLLITGDRKYVAKFAKGQVSLSYEIGEGAEGTAPETVTRAKGKKVRLATDEGISKKDAKFIGWSIDGKIYKPGDEITLNENTTAKACWKEDEDVIPYNPEEPKSKPSGYHRVKFEADNGLELSDVNYYYVKDGSTLKLDNQTPIKYPTASPKVGYKFDKWDNGPEIKNITEDVTIKATSSQLPPTIEKKDGEDKPAGFVEVKFVAGEHGQLEKDGNKIEEKIYYVNPTKYVKLSPPSTEANTGYKFGNWSMDASQNNNYTKDNNHSKL